MKGTPRGSQRAVDVGRTDVGKALNALDIDDLRALVVETLDALDEGPRRRLEVSLLQRAASRKATTSPGTTPSQTALADKSALPTARAPQSQRPATPPPSPPPSPSRPATAPAAPPGDVEPRRTAFDYLAEVEAHLAAGRADEAIRCAEASLAIFPRGLKGRFQRKLGEAYAAKGQPDRAVEAVWRGFVEDPGPEHFRTLRRRAKAAGAWPAWRKRALDHLAIEHPNAKMASSALVEILLFEGTPLEALREAKRRPIWPRTWLRLIGVLAESHPREALALYSETALPQLARAKLSRNKINDALRVLRELQRGASKAGANDGFQALIAKIRRDLGAKRALIEALDKEGWPVNAT